LPVGRKDGTAAQAVVELIDYYDESTGFTAMERTTGWDASIKAIMNAQGITPKGVKPAEIAVLTVICTRAAKERLI
jgi:lysine 6-dehydrogenase